jgi:hypothetical protein
LVAFDASFTKGQIFLSSSAIEPIAGPDMGPALTQGVQAFAAYFQARTRRGSQAQACPLDSPVTTSSARR